MWRNIATGALALSLASCGGGGGGGGSTPPVPVSGPGTAVVQIGGSNPGISARHDHYVDQTQTAAVGVIANNGPETIVACTTVSPLLCQVTVPVNGGQNVFIIKTYSFANVVLSQATIVADCKAGQRTVIKGTLSGVPVVATVALQGVATVGTPSNIPVIVTAYDGAGDAIVGSAQYSSPIALTDTDTSGVTHLSKPAAASPTDSVSLIYDGSKLVSAGVTTPTGQSASLIIVSPVVEYPLTAYSGSDIVTGSDGALWFSEQQHIARITTSGALTEYQTNGQAQAAPAHLLPVSDGTIWFTDVPSLTGNLPQIEQITMNGSITAHALNTAVASGNLPAQFHGLAADRSGNLWSTLGDGRVAKYSNGVLTTYTPGNGFLGDDVALGSDGMLWMTNAGWDVYRFDPSTQTVVSDIAIGGPTGPVIYATNIFAASDGSMYAYGNGTVQMSAGGAIVQRNDFIGGLCGSNSRIAVQNGVLWIAASALAKDSSTWYPELARIDSSGNVTYVPLSVAGTSLSDATVCGLGIGPDGKLWYTRGKHVGHLL